jgi:hypothetical protein
MEGFVSNSIPDPQHWSSCVSPVKHTDRFARRFWLLNPSINRIVLWWIRIGFNADLCKALKREPFKTINFLTFFLFVVKEIKILRFNKRPPFHNKCFNYIVYMVWLNTVIHDDTC